MIRPNNHPSWSSFPFSSPRDVFWKRSGRFGNGSGNEVETGGNEPTSMETKRKRGGRELETAILTFPNIPKNQQSLHNLSPR